LKGKLGDIGPCEAKNTAEKDLATKFANDVNGVKSVKNRMTSE
jgi:osmotically-inducible protein OsmY